jgi:membrane protein implicated in regulation of membrane protease activity
VPASPLAFRSLTLVAATFLAFDGAALAGLGIWSGRGAFLVTGVVLFLSSGLVLLLWRRHLRRLGEIDEARQDLREETEELRRLLRE